MQFLSGRPLALGILGIILQFLPAPGVAQSPRRNPAAASVHTLVAPVPRMALSHHADSVYVEIKGEAGVRIYQPARSSLKSMLVQDSSFLVAFGFSRMQRAGHVVVGIASFVSRSGERLGEVEMSYTIAEQRRLAMSVLSAPDFVSRSNIAYARVRVTNLGNVPERFVLRAGGDGRVRAYESAQILVDVGRDSVLAIPLRAEATGAPGRFLSRFELIGGPDVIVGSVSVTLLEGVDGTGDASDAIKGQAGLVLGERGQSLIRLSARARISAEHSLEFDVSNVDGRDISAGVYREFWASPVQIKYTSPGRVVSAGYGVGPTSAIVSGRIAGYGLFLREDVGNGQVTVAVAPGRSKFGTPGVATAWSGALGDAPTQVMVTTTKSEDGYWRFQGVSADAEHGFGGAGLARITLGGARQPDGRFSPAADGRAVHSGGYGNIGFSGAWVAASDRRIPTVRVGGNGTLNLPVGLRASGVFYSTDEGMLTRRTKGEYASVSGGWNHGPLQSLVSVGRRLQSIDDEGGLSLSDERSRAVQLGYRGKRFQLHGSGGRVQDGDSGSVSTVGTLYLNSSFPGGWLSTALSYDATDPLGHVRFEIGGRTPLPHKHTLEGRISGLRPSGFQGAVGDLSISGEIRRDLRYVAGLRFQASTGPRLSIGISRGFSTSLPLPGLSRTVPARVWEDVNADGIFQAGEPSLAGVDVHVHGRRYQSDETGSFAVPRTYAGSDSVRVDLASLGSGWLRSSADARIGLASSSIPVYRAASLRVTPFVDVDGNGVRGVGEPVAMQGFVVLEGDPAHDGVYSVQRDGHLFAGLRPGRYQVGFVRRPQDADSAVLSTVAVLASGEAVSIDLAVAPGQENIVFSNPDAPLRVVLFEDEDGDGRRSSGEPVLPFALLLADTLITPEADTSLLVPRRLSGVRGIQLDSTATSLGYILLDPSFTVSPVQRSVAVYRGASLVAHSVRDGDGDKIVGAEETACSDGWVSLANARGESVGLRRGCNARFDRLLPGRYTLTSYGDGPYARVDVVVRSGTESVVTIAADPERSIPPESLIHSRSDDLSGNPTVSATEKRVSVTLEAWHDRDGDGQRSANEEPVAGVRLRVGGREFLSAADSVARFSLPSGLADEGHVTAPAGWIASILERSGRSYRIGLLRPAAVSIKIRYDRNGNQSLDPGEREPVDAQVRLLRFGKPVAYGVTEGGGWRVDGLMPGVYDIAIFAHGKVQKRTVSLSSGVDALVTAVVDKARATRPSSTPHLLVVNTQTARRHLVLRSRGGDVLALSVPAGDTLVRLPVPGWWSAVVDGRRLDGAIHVDVSAVQTITLTAPLPAVPAQDPDVGYLHLSRGRAGPERLLLVTAAANDTVRLSLMPGSPTRLALPRGWYTTFGACGAQADGEPVYHALGALYLPAGVTVQARIQDCSTDGTAPIVRAGDLIVYLDYAMRTLILFLIAIICGLAYLGRPSAVSAQSVYHARATVDIPEIVAIDFQGEVIEFPSITGDALANGQVLASTATTLGNRGNVGFVVFIQAATPFMLRPDGSPTSKPAGDLEYSLDGGKIWTALSTDAQALGLVSELDGKRIIYRMRLRPGKDSAGAVVLDFLFKVVSN